MYIKRKKATQINKLSGIYQVPLPKLSTTFEIMFKYQQILNTKINNPQRHDHTCIKCTPEKIRKTKAYRP